MCVPCSYDGERRKCLNLGSYNYLGFADDWNVTCREHVMSAFDDFNTNCCSTPSNSGTTVLHRELEAAVARFINKPACIVFNMGYGTNAGSIASILGKVSGEACCGQLSLCDAVPPLLSPLLGCGDGSHYYLC